MSRGTLHVTNGNAVVYLFKKAGIVGPHLAWRDGLNEGPVPAGLSLRETSAIRAAFAAQRGYASPIKTIHDFDTRDALLQAAAEFGEVVLWFEHDLYDQLQMLQVLTSLEDLALEAGRVSLVQSDHYLGMMTSEELTPLLRRRRIVTAATFTSARRAWGRFTSSDPQELLAAAREDAIGLPFLRAALRRLCEEYPDVHDGLSRSHRQALEAIAAGPGSPEELFKRAQAREDAAFLGDSAFSKIVDDLIDSRAPLAQRSADALRPTDLGRRVLAGEADWLAESPQERWIGGVALTDRPARWDPDAERFVL